MDLHATATLSIPATSTAGNLGTIYPGAAVLIHERSDGNYRIYARGGVRSFATYTFSELIARVNPT